ncbi:hypothetical protein SAMN04487964_10479 [Marinobacterium sediminicola]|uniref:Uncharacterized protein n=1 Tax=Marinobacterium sediminicola TaxID=518898 RepID=A0ABY1RYY9_9GAMM|nr:hypothetical protein SAMN04487964_10479 [Marinobacterium sediminicola]
MSQVSSIPKWDATAMSLRLNYVDSHSTDSGRTEDYSPKSGRNNSSRVCHWQIAPDTGLSE